MFKKIRRALGAASRPGAAPARPVMQTRYHWRCACGAHSRGGSLNEGDVKYNADRHLWSKYKDKQHPTPEVYTTEEERPY
ncbi:hypothetical protein ABT224_19610 [Streptomyces sp. NPDC001584]|uniref:hypothetical protein n=1 Tax=Streptomyces sp. NPDC001584 TaxID=3154521 RepID=UPI003320F176